MLGENNFFIYFPIFLTWLLLLFFFFFSPKFDLDILQYFYSILMQHYKSPHMLDFLLSMKPVQVSKRILLFLGDCKINYQQCEDITFIFLYRKYTSLMHNSNLSTPWMINISKRFWLLLCYIEEIQIFGWYFIKAVNV